MAYRKPRRFFEDSGLVDPKNSFHVGLSPVENTKGQDMRSMVDAGRYFSIFAPRQSGKTTFFRDFCAQLSSDPTYIPILLSFQFMKNLEIAVFYQEIQKSLFDQLRNRLAAVKCVQKEAVDACLNDTSLLTHIDLYNLFETLNRLIQQKKIVIFIDEFDGIPRSDLENFLTTLRELYQKYKERTDKALYSVGLVGIRNITKLIVGGVSPFNIADQVQLPPFTLQNVYDLYGQYTAETGQPFTEAAVKKVHAQTAGQPWLVNRLGTLLTVKIKPATVQAIEENDVDQAIDMLLYEENSHFDNLTAKARQYKEAFIEVVFNSVSHIPGDETQSYLMTYGLVASQQRRLKVANVIYRKRFTQTFFREAGARTDIQQRSYYTSDGNLDMEAILYDFEEYIMQIGVNAFYAKGEPREKTGQFLLTAWLYQFVEQGRGELRHEVSSGLGRMDMLLTWRGRKYIVETKLNHGRLARTISQAVDQVAGKYLASERCDEGYVVVFDPKRAVGDLVDPAQRAVDGRQVSVFIIGIGKP